MKLKEMGIPELVKGFKDTSTTKKIGIIATLFLVIALMSELFFILGIVLLVCFVIKYRQDKKKDRKKDENK